MDWWATCERLMALNRDLAAIQPALKLEAVRFEGDALTVTARSAAVAARLRQVAPGVVEGLRARGWTVRTIRFRPSKRIAERAVRIEPKAQRPISNRSLESLQTLLAQEDLPPALWRSIRALVQQQLAYRDRED